MPSLLQTKTTHSRHRASLDCMAERGTFVGFCAPNQTHKTSTVIKVFEKGGRKEKEAEEEAAVRRQEVSL